MSHSQMRDWHVVPTRAKTRSRDRTRSCMSMACRCQTPSQPQADQGEAASALPQCYLEYKNQSFTITKKPV
jgi:hypothetical protein